MLDVYFVRLSLVLCVTENGFHSKRNKRDSMKQNLKYIVGGASGKAGIRNPESGIGTGIGTGTGTGTGIGTGMGRETYIKAGTTFTLI